MDQKHIDKLQSETIALFESMVTSKEVEKAVDKLNKSILHEIHKFAKNDNYREFTKKYNETELIQIGSNIVDIININKTGFSQNMINMILFAGLVDAIRLQQTINDKSEGANDE